MTDKRRVGVLALLTRQRWSGGDGWSVRCRDTRGRRCRLRVSVHARGVLISIHTADGDRVEVVVSTVRAGRHRRALRDAIATHTRLAEAATTGPASPRTHPGPAPTPHAARYRPHTSGGRVRVAVWPEPTVEPPRGRHARDTRPYEPPPRAGHHPQALAAS